MSMLIVSSNNLSLAWTAAIAHVAQHPGTNVSPLLFQLKGFENNCPEEIDAVRHVLDEMLENQGIESVHTVANTIFPERLWQMANGNRKVLFDRYKKAVPRYRKLEPYKNGRGLYFERLIDYGRGPEDGNQLEYVLKAFRPGVVQMKLQVSVFDPERDLIPGARIGFPCLQQISFIPHQGNLQLNAFYATQQLFEKAYGNLLGLSRLGRFVAQELHLDFVQLNLLCRQ